MTVAVSLLDRLADKDILRGAGAIGGERMGISETQATFDVRRPTADETLATIPDFGVGEVRAIEPVHSAPIDWVALVSHRTLAWRMTMLTGSCHCGQVQYEVRAIEGGLWHCHCRTCRKTHAAQRNTAARVDREKFIITRGKEKLAAYESSPGKFRHFCSSCGCHVYAEYPELPFVVLRAATLDADPGVHVAMSVWLSHDLPWLSENPSVPRHLEGPPPAAK